jgi:hypothetical protein
MPLSGMREAQQKNFALALSKEKSLALSKEKLLFV